MNKDDAASTKRFVDEAARMRHPDEKILVRLVFNRYTQVPYARLWMMSGDRFGANRDDMCNTPFCQRAGRLCRDETSGWEVVNMQAQKTAFDKFRRRRTYFPKKSLPSMTTLTFLNPILVRAGQGGEDRGESFNRVVSRGP
jgi:hypothetical protein